MCKVIVLLIPATLTVGLLSFCLISDWWISVDEIKLNAFKTTQEQAFNAYIRGEADPTLATISTTTRKTTTTTPDVLDPTTIVVKTKKNKPTLQEEFSDTYDSNDANLYDDEEASLSNHTLDEEESDLADVKRMRKREQPSTPKDYVYVTKLWPLTKSKSLFSECIRYEKLTLKMSVAYLNMSNKEPILGTIHYGGLLNATSEEAVVAANEMCQGKMGMISCSLNNECVQGTM